MKCPFRVRNALVVGLITLRTMVVFAEHPPADVAPDRPFATLFLSSLSNFRSGCEQVFHSVQRPELFDSMDSRLERYHDFAGIDRDKPIGMMFVWNKQSTGHIVFLPVSAIDELLKTATFGVVDYRKVTLDHYELGTTERRHHVLVRKDYAFFSETLSTIQALRTTPDQITRRLRDQYGLVLRFDLGQIPSTDKRRMVSEIRAVIEPGLQSKDDESKESARIRKLFGEALLTIIERTVMDLQNLTIGARLDPETRHLRFEVVLEAVPKSSLAHQFKQSSARTQRFAGFLESDRDAAAVAVMNLAVSHQFDQSRPTKGGKRQVTISRFQAMMEIVGEHTGDRSVLGAVHGADVKSLNEALPGLVAARRELDQVESALELFRSERDITMHSLIPSNVPHVISDWMGAPPELILSPNNDTIWIGMGSHQNLSTDLEEAMEFSETSLEEQTSVPILEARLKGRAIPEFVASNPLIPNMDTDRVRQELQQGDDGVSVKIEAVPTGIKLSLDFEEGFVRLIGRDWIRQIEAFHQ